MGVYIPNMEIPKSCGECRFRQTIGVDRWRCSFTKSEFNSWDVGWGTGSGENGNNPYIRHDACPLVHVPPHGRLGDLDALREIFRWGEEEKAYTACSMEQIYETIDETPTIIPAEEGDMEAEREYEAAVEMAQYCERYESTYDPNTGAL